MNVKNGIASSSSLDEDAAEDAAGDRLQNSEVEEARARCRAAPNTMPSAASENATG